MNASMLGQEESSVPAEAMAAAETKRRAVIAGTAYRLAQARGFAPGHELDDWLEAERQCEAWERGCGRDPDWP